MAGKKLAVGAKEPAKEKEKKERPKKEKKDDDEKKDKRRGKRHSNSYASYIYKVLKQVHPDTGISRKAMIIMDNFINDIFHHSKIQS